MQELNKDLNGKYNLVDTNKLLDQAKKELDKALQKGYLVVVLFKI